MSLVKDSWQPQGFKWRFRRPPRSTWKCISHRYDVFCVPSCVFAPGGDFYFIGDVAIIANGDTVRLAVEAAKVLEEKKAVVASLVEKIKNSPAGVLVDYKGINVEDDTKLRKQLREAGVEYAVIKNTLIRFAAKELGFDWDENLHGTTALAISTTDDVVAPAKILADFAKTHENFNLKAGYLEGKVIGEDEVKKLAAMPSKEVLIAQVLYSFNFPIMQLAIACDAIVKKAEGNEEMKVAELVAPKEAAAEEAVAEDAE